MLRTREVRTKTGVPWYTTWSHDLCEHPDSNIQLSAPKSPFLKLGNNTLQKQVEKNAPRSNEGPPELQNAYSFSFRCLFVDKPKLLRIGDQMYVCGLFGDSPCRDSRRDKNKSWRR